MTNILAINTAGETELLLLQGEREYYFRERNMRLTGEILLPELERLLLEAGIKIDDVDCICPVVGPGSFTGARIGVVTAKAFALSGKMRIAPVTFNEVVSYNYIPREGVHTVVDGSGGTFYHAQVKGGALSAIRCLTGAALKAELGGESRIACDRTSAQIFGGALCEGAQALRLAAKSAAANGPWVSAAELEPLYIRKAQPQREAGDL